MEVLLGHLSDDSVAPAIFGLVRGGAAARPKLAEDIRGSIVIRFQEDYPAVRIDFRGDEIEVGDERHDEDRAADLLVTGRIGDINALIAAPLSAGLPRPTSPRGRKALARLADGRVEFDGPLRLGRKLIMLLTLEDALPRRRRSRSRAGT
jgi:hypothetical protein